MAMISVLSALLAATLSVPAETFEAFSAVSPAPEPVNALAALGKLTAPV